MTSAKSSDLRPRPASPPAPPAGRATRGPLHMIGNAHIDAVWLWPWQEGYQEARATFRAALDRIEEYPDFVFTCASVAYLAWIEEHDPAAPPQVRHGQLRVHAPAAAGGRAAGADVLVAGGRRLAGADVPDPA